MNRAPYASVTLGRVGLAGLVLAASGATISCSSQATRESRVIQATAEISDPIRVLEARAELEALSPLEPADERVIAALMGDGLEEITPGSPGYARAVMAPAEIEYLMPAYGPADSGTIEGRGTDGPNDGVIDPLRRSQAVKLYARARLMIQDDRAGDAVAVLEQAGRLDPESSKIKRLMGDAQVASGDLSGAVLSYERGIELGDRSAAALVHVASNANSLGQYERVMSLTIMALESGDSQREPVAMVLAGIMLGNAQIRLGYLRAGAESLEKSLGRFDPRIRDPRWRQEIVQVLGQASSLWVHAGDAWNAIGSYARADSAYEKASMTDGPVPIGLIGRQIGTELRRGHHAGAALRLLDHLAKQSSDLADEETRWVEALAGIDSLKGVLGGSIGRLEVDAEGSPTIQRALLRLQLVAVDRDEALDLLSSNEQPIQTELIADVLDRFDTPGDMLDASLTLVRRRPELGAPVASALARVHPSPIEVLTGGLDADTPESQLLLASLGIALGRADLIGHLETLGSRGFETTSESVAWLGAHGRAAALSGRWDLARKIASELRTRSEEGDDHATLILSGTLVVLEQPREAWALARSLGDDADAEVETLKTVAQIALMLDKADAARSYLERANERDPLDTDVVSRLIRIGDEDGNEDQELTRALVRRLGTTRPRSVFFGLLRATDLARGGMVDEAERLLLRLNEGQRHADVGTDLLLSIWKTRASEGDADAIDEGIEWLGARLADRPASVQTAIALAQLEYEQQENQAALELLEDCSTRTGSYEIDRAIEQILRDQLGQQDEARARLEDRLRENMGVDAGIELGLDLARRGDLDSAERSEAELEARLNAGIELLPAQQRQLAQIVYAMAEYADLDGIDPVMLRVIALIEDHSSAGLGYFLARTKLLLLSREPTIDADALLTEVERQASMLDDPGQGEALRALPVQVLLGEDRGDEAIGLMARMAISQTGLDPEKGVELYRMLGAVGTDSDLESVLGVLEDHGMLAEMIDLTIKRLGTPARDVEGLDVLGQRADLAYTAAAMASAFERPDQAEGYYELALSYDPDHAWSNNDYGYLLADRGERLDEAETMLVRAAAALPDEASVIDSLGWLRYKAGVFEDVVDAQSGTVLKEGAITLLSRANRLDRTRSNATIMTHLGDALWRAGQNENAVEAWLVSEGMLRSRMRLLSGQPEPNRSAIEAVGAELRQVRYRIQDSEAGGNPKVAPTADEMKPGDEPRESSSGG